MTNKKLWCVYMHIFPNGKKYIGVAIINDGQTPLEACQKRWGNNGSGYNTQRVGRAINKYGWENIKHKILFERVSEDEIDDLEIFLIQKYDTQIDNGKGYNVDLGGKHRIVSDSTRKKLSKSLSGEKHPMYGKHKSEETKKKIGKAQIGKFVSEETREKIRKAQTWQKGKNNPRYGKHCTEETKRKISEALSGKYVGEDSYWYGRHLSDESKEKLRQKALIRYSDITNHPNYGKPCPEKTKQAISDKNSKSVLVFNLLGDFVIKYKSASECADDYGIVFSSICNAANGNHLVVLNKFIIIYEDDYSDELLNSRLIEIRNTKRKYTYLNYIEKVVSLKEQGYKTSKIMEEVGIKRDMYYSCIRHWKEIKEIPISNIEDISEAI